MQLKNKVAIITGASSGIGAAAARKFAEEGAQLVLGARRKDRLEALVQEIKGLGGDAVYVAGDVTDEAFAEELSNQAKQQFGGLDIAFNNAGVIGPMGECANLSASDWRDTIDINLTGGFLCAKYQIPLLVERGGGSLIFTSSFVGYSVGFPGVSPYAASKAGLIGLTQSLATEVGPSGVRVNALLPGGTRTDMADDFTGGGDPDEAIAPFHALKRIAEAEEIASAALFLASDASSFVTGSAMLADGGNSITKV